MLSVILRLAIVFVEGPMRLAFAVRANCSSVLGFRGAGMSGAALRSDLHSGYT